MVENLEGKILNERKELKTKTERLELEINHYSDLEKLHEIAEITKVYLIQMKERYIQRRDFMKSTVKDVSTEYKQSKKSLDDSETWKSLLELEEKLRRQGQVTFTLQEFVKTKERQTNYETVKSTCLQIINGILVESAGLYKSTLH